MLEDIDFKYGYRVEVQWKNQDRAGSGGSSLYPIRTLEFPIQIEYDVHSLSA